MSGEKEASAWQPIETAPRDGTRVLVWDGKHGGHYVARYDEDDLWEWGNDLCGSLEPTHWMPLPPEPPTTCGEKSPPNR